MLTFEVIRFLMAFCSGILLSLSGGLVQGVTHNELSGPSTLGMEGVSVLFIIIAYSFKMASFGFVSYLGLEVSSFLLFFLAWGVLLLAFYKKTQRKRTNEFKIYGNKIENKMGRFLLMGLCFNLFIGAFFSVLHFLFMNMNKEFPGQIWFGNFRFIPDYYLWIIVPLTLSLYFLSIKLSKTINFLIYGEDFAQGFDIPVEKIQGYSILLSLLSQGIVVSFFGVFAFIAIIFPHFLRAIPLFKSRFDFEIKYGSFLCGMLMMGLDMICYYNPIYGAEIPVGMLSSVVGPFFLILLVLRKPKLFLR